MSANIVLKKLKDQSCKTHLLMMNVVDYNFFSFFFNLLKIFDYKWIQVGSIKLEANVACLSWNPDSNRLLFGLQNKSIQIWSYNSDILNSSTLDCTLTSSCSSTSSSSFNKNNNKKHSIFIRALREENLDDSVKSPF